MSSSVDLAPRVAPSARHGALRWPREHTHRRLGTILRLAGALPYPAWRTPTSMGPQLTVLIPAHDEEATLPAALASLRWQALAPTRVVVVADDCTDGTVRCAGRASTPTVASGPSCTSPGPCPTPPGAPPPRWARS